MTTHQVSGYVHRFEYLFGLAKSGKVELQPPLHSAIISGKRAKITRLLEGNTNIDAQDRNGQTALHLAVGMGKVASVGLLLEHGASAAIQNSNKHTAYDIANTRLHPKIAHLMQDRQSQRSLAITVYEAGHLFDRFQLIFTHGVKQWSDADILLIGEKHAWADLTRWFVSNFAPTQNLLVCIEGTPSMRRVKDPQTLKPKFFDERNVNHRQTEFIGWDAEEHLLPQGNDYQMHTDLLSLQHTILNAIDNTYERLKTLYTDCCSASQTINEGLQAAGLDQLRAFCNQNEKLIKLREQFVAARGSSDPFDRLRSIQERSALLIQIIEISYSLKIDFPSLWETQIGANEYATYSSVLRSVIDRMDYFHTQLESVQMELSRGCVTNKQIRETFPARTAAMISTMKNLGQLIARGMTGKIVLVAGASHLKTSEKDQTKPEFDLASFCEELRNHKVAVVVQTP